MPNSDTPHITNNHSMILKTWLTDLTKIQGVANNIKSIELWTNGDTRLLNPSVVNNLSSAINGLNLQQARLALSTRNLTKEQINQVLVQAGLIASENTIKAELVQSALAQAGLSAEKQMAILTELGLMDATTLDILTTKSCTKEKLLNMLATKGVTGANAEEIISILGLAEANSSATISFKLLTASIWENIKALGTWLITNPIGWITAAVAVIFAAVKLVDLFTTSLKEQQDATKKLQDELSEIQSNIEELDSELKTVGDRIDELNAKDNPSFVEKEELQDLKALNKELERRNKTLAEQEAVKKQEVADSVKKEYDKEYGNSDYQPIQISQKDLEEQAEIESKRSRYQELSEKYKLDDAEYEEMLELQKEIYEWETKTSLSFSEHIQDIINSYNDLNQQQKNGEDLSEDDLKQLEEWRNELVNTAVDLDDYVDRYGVDDETSQSWHNLSVAISDCLYPADALTEKFNEVFNGLSHDVQNELTALAKAGTLSVDDLSEEIIEKFKEAGFTADEVIEQIKSGVENLSDTKPSLPFATILSQIQSLSEGLDQLDKIYTDIYNKEDFDWSSILGSESFQKAFGKMGDSYDNFIKTVSNAPDDLEACQSAFDDLVTSYLYSAKDADGNSIMGNLTEETKEATVAMLEQMGAANALEVVEAQLAQNTGYLTSAKKEQSEICRLLSQNAKSENATKLLTILSSIDLKNATYEEIQSLIDEAGQLGITSDALTTFKLSKMDLNSTPISTGEDIDNLLSMADAAGIATKSVGKLAALKTAYDKAVADMEKGVTGAHYRASGIAAEMQKAAEDAQKDILNFRPTVQYSSGSGYRSAVSSIQNDAEKTAEETAEEIEDTAKDQIDSYLNYMKSSLEAGRTDYRTYARDVSAFLRNMFDEGKISAQEYHDYVGQMLETQKSILDKASSAVTSRLDREIDSLRDKMDEIEENYNSQMEYLDTVIEYHEKQKEILQDENDELDRQKALEEALYNLQRAQNQKTIALYTAVKGKIYIADASAVRDAEDSARKAKLDMELARIDEAIEKVEKQQEALKEAMDTEKEQLQAVIDRLEEYKKQWSSVASEYEDIQNDMLARQVLGADYESKILDGRLDVLNDFKNEYLSIQKAITDAAWESSKAQLEASQTPQNVQNTSTSATSAPDATKQQQESTPLPAEKWYIHEYIYNYKTKTGKVGTRLAGPYSSQTEAAKNSGIYAARTASHQVTIQKGYASGTRHAQRGLNLVGEEGTETYIDNDGNISLVTNPSLINMEGGETVINASKTEKLLDNGHKLAQRSTMEFAGLNPETVHLTMDEWKNRLQSVMPDFVNMVQIPGMQAPKDDLISVSRDINITVNNGDIHLHEVQNVDGFAKAIINELPGKVLQNLGKR